MGQDPPGPGAVQIDEAWLCTWLEQGLADIAKFLANHALLDAYCAEHHRPQGEP